MNTAALEVIEQTFLDEKKRESEMVFKAEAEKSLMDQVMFDVIF